MRDVENGSVEMTGPRNRRKAEGYQRSWRVPKSRQKCPNPVEMSASMSKFFVQKCLEKQQKIDRSARSVLDLLV